MRDYADEPISLPDGLLKPLIALLKVNEVPFDFPFVHD